MTIEVGVSRSDLAIEVRGLEFTYAGRNEPTVRSVSFDVRRGQIVGLLGPSGAGKSTTQKILTGLLSGYAGSACVLGREVRRWGSGLYGQIGVGFELPNHYQKLSARENLALFGSFYTRSSLRDPQQLLRELGLEADADKPVGAFSKGMKMRLSFARAVQHDPAILFLDEPTSGLDPVNAARLKEQIVALKQAGKAILLTTHDMHDAEELCDQVAFMAAGAIQVIDTPHNLRTSRGKRRLRVEYQTTAGRVEQRELSFDELATDEVFMRILRENRVVSMHSQEPTLDELFAQLTGYELQ